MRSKGLMMGFVTFMVMILFISMVFYSGFIAKGELERELTFSTGHVNNVMQAKTRKEIYEKNMKKEINYTTNNIAYLIGRNGGELNWDNNIPTESKIEEEFKSNILGYGEHDLRDQNRLKECSPVSIQPGYFEIVNNNEFKLDWSNDAIRLICSSADSEVKLPLEEYTVDNENNNYLHLAKYARELADYVDSNAPQDTIGVENTSECFTSEGDAKDFARIRAKENFTSKYNDFTEEAFQNTDSERENYVHMLDSLSNTTFQGTTSIDDFKKGSECSNSLFDKYHINASFEANQMETTFNIMDDQNEVITFDGNKFIHFIFTYEKALP